MSGDFGKSTEMEFLLETPEARALRKKCLNFQ
jgi:hypothetical protein